MESESMSEFDESTRLIITYEDISDKLGELLYRDAETVKEICITNLDKPCDEYFSKFLSHFSDINSLEIEGSGVVTDYHLKVIGANLRQLQCLSIKIKTSITDAGIGFLVGDDKAREAPCPLLETLEIIKPHLITDKGILRLTSKLKKLQNLDMWATKVDSRVARYLKDMSSLRKVTVRNSNRISLTGYKVMGQGGFKMEFHGIVGGESAYGFMHMACWSR